MDQRAVSPILGSPFHTHLPTNNAPVPLTRPNSNQRNTGERHPPDAGCYKQSRLGIVQTHPSRAKQSAVGDRLQAPLWRNGSRQRTCPLSLSAAGPPANL